MPTWSEPLPLAFRVECPGGATGPGPMNPSGIHAAGNPEDGSPVMPSVNGGSAVKDLRTLVIAIAVGLMGHAGSAGAQETWREQSQKTYEAAAVRSIRIENPRGEIRARPSADGKIHLTVLKTARGRTNETAKQMARSVLVELDSRGQELTLVVRYPQRMNINVDFWDIMAGRPTPKLEVRVDVEVPADRPLVLRSTSGDLITVDLAGPQNLQSTSGDVSVRGARGRVEVVTTSGDVKGGELSAARVSTASGDVTVNGTRGSLWVETSSGDVIVRDALDSLALSTGSGDIDVDGAPRGVIAGTSSGDCEVRGIAGMVEVETGSGQVVLGLVGPIRSGGASTSSGDVEITIGPKVACTFSLRTSSGTIDMDLPVELRQATRREVTAVLRGGTAPFQVSTGSGDMTLSAGSGKE